MKTNSINRGNDVHISLPPALLDALDRYTEDTGATRSGTIAVALRRFLGKYLLIETVERKEGKNDV